MNAIMQSPLFHDSPWRNRGAGGSVFRAQPK